MQVTIRDKYGYPIETVDPICFNLTRTLCIHKLRDADRRKGDSRRYTITHILSGNAVRHRIRGLRRAENLLDAIDRRGYDWAFRKYDSPKRAKIAETINDLLDVERKLG